MSTKTQKAQTFYSYDFIGLIDSVCPVFLKVFLRSQSLGLDLFLLVPLNRPAQAFFETDLGCEAKGLLGAAHIELAPRLAIWLGCVPDDASLEFSETDNGL